jgi:hypothetical protein
MGDPERVKGENGICRVRMAVDARNRAYRDTAAHHFGEYANSG